MAGNGYVIPEDEEYGIAQAQRATARGFGRVPGVKLTPGERAIFWCLTTGRDPYFAGGRFHDIGQGSEYRRFFCMKSLGEECVYCERDPETWRKKRFGLWIWLDSIYHLGDNPDESGDSWEPKRIGNRNLFREPIGDMRLLELTNGRNDARFQQFVEMALTYGGLNKVCLMLHRTGVGLDADYHLSMVKEIPVPEDVLEKCQDRQKVMDLWVQQYKRSLTPAASGAVQREIADAGSLLSDTGGWLSDEKTGVNLGGDDMI